MKKTLLILVIITSFNSIANSQIMSLHLLKYENSMNPLFSKKSKQILITFDRNSLIDSPHIYNYLFKIDISDRKSELTGVVNDINISGAMTAINRYGVLGGVLASSFTSAKQFSYRNTNGFVLFERAAFDSLINYSEKIIKVLDSLKPPQNFSRSYFFKIDKLELSLEAEQVIESMAYANTYANGTSSRYVLNKTIFLKIDESIYVLTEEEFKELYNTTFLQTQALWNNK